MPAPAALALYGDIDFGARNSAVRAVAIMVNAWNTYWTSATAKCIVPDQTVGENKVHDVSALNSIINCVNAMNTEFTLGATATPVLISSDYTHFQPVINRVIAQMIVMQAAKP